MSVWISKTRNRHMYIAAGWWYAICRSCQQLAQWIQSWRLSGRKTGGGYCWHWYPPAYSRATWKRARRRVASLLVTLLRKKIVAEQAAVAAARAFPGLQGIDLAKEVTTHTPYEWAQGSWTLADGLPKAPHPIEEKLPYHVVAYDYGVKRNILRMLVDRGCRLTGGACTDTGCRCAGFESWWCSFYPMALVIRNPAIMHWRQSRTFWPAVFLSLVFVLATSCCRWPAARRLWRWNSVIMGPIIRYKTWPMAQWWSPVRITVLRWMKNHCRITCKPPIAHYLMVHCREWNVLISLPLVFRATRKPVPDRMMWHRCLTDLLNRSNNIRERAVNNQGRFSRFPTIRHRK